ncbi:MAG TPA: ferritin family protein [bacterium]
MTRKLEELTPKEVLALAISIEQSNGKALHNFAEMFDGYDQEVSKNFEEMSVEEGHHEQLLLQKFKKLFKGPIPEITNFDVEEVVEAIDLDDSEHLIFDSLKAKQVYQLAYEAEKRARSFYEKAMKTVKNKELASLFKELAEMEGDHATWLEIKIKLENKIK